MPKRMMLLAVLLMGLFSLSGALMAQSDEIVLTISLNRSNFLTEAVLQGFYDTHPNVRIEINGDGDMRYGGDIRSVVEIDGVLDKAEAYFGGSDIVAISMSNLHPFATRAGYVLDMTPYIQADSETYEDLYPVALKMYQWDGGMWGLPVAFTTWFMTYDPAAFEAAGYPVPDESWTLDDYLDAARALTERDENGVVTRPGFTSPDGGMLLGPTMGIRFYDDSTQPESPLLAQPAVEEMLVKLKTYNDEMRNSAEGVRYNEAPLQMGGLWRLTDANGQTPYMPASLSPEHILVGGDGFAISAGTQHPQLAYEFIAYLSTNMEAVAYYSNDLPLSARRSLAGQSASAEWNFSPIPAVIEAQLPDILEHGIPTSEARYGEYIYPTLDKIYADPTLTTPEALQQTQQEAIDNLKIAEARSEQALNDSSPAATPGAAQEEITISFLVDSRFALTPNKDAWEQLAESFAESDPEVGQVKLLTEDPASAEVLQTVDCAYTSYNTLSLVDLALLQPLDPFLSADSELDRSDTPDALWRAVTRDEKIYGLPITVMPLMMWYSPDSLEAAGHPLPHNGWTMSEFINLMTILKEAEPDDAAYYSETWSYAPYLLLAAGLGGVAVDYKTDPPTYHLTDPAVVDALRQTFDLVKQGLIHYNPNSPYAGSGGAELYDEVGIYTSWDNIGPGKNLTMPVTFPRGEMIIPLSYVVGTGTITAQTPHPEACYRWLNTVAQHPELFYDMPARASQANSDALLAAQGQIASDIYVTYFEMLNDPNAVFIPTVKGRADYSPRVFIPEIWLNQVLYTYAQGDTDLESDLAQAQTYIDEFRICSADILPINYSNASDSDRQAYDQQFIDCAISIDPSMRDRLASFKGE